MIRYILLSVFMIFGSILETAADDFNKGVKAFQNSDYVTALRLWKPIADNGEPVAQHNLGILYEYGFGVSQDYGAAVQWYTRSAEQGYANAQTALGGKYNRGVGVEKL